MSENQAKNRLKKRCFNLIGHWLLCHYLFQMVDWRWSVFLNQLGRTHEPCVPTWLLRPYYRTMRLMFHRNSRTPDATKTCLALHVLFLSPEKTETTADRKAVVPNRQPTISQKSEVFIPRPCPLLAGGPRQTWPSSWGCCG